MPAVKKVRRKKTPRKSKFTANRPNKSPDFLPLRQQPKKPFSARPIKQKKGIKKPLLFTISAIIIITGFYFIVYPFWPQIQYRLFPPNQSQPTEITTSKHVNNTDYVLFGQLPTSHKKAPPGNKIIIPKIGVEMPIVEGTDEKVSLNQGAWRMPATSTPDQGGNTVITAHRFRYKPPSQETFYLLDKLTTGDIVTVNWEELEYNYKVTNTKVVEPTALEVLDNTATPEITLITCTPLFTTKQRLIVIAEPI